ncbi:unnamed protein product [Gongylonema pulchrum]|uniref:GRIP domain-containing protein n=1 Tax=Gongylonema pulchrum TaxID=637853 RepID=A0A183ELZ1_9BILA|nr:unnamed protein product [Gongylonema pulchrum]
MTSLRNELTAQAVKHNDVSTTVLNSCRLDFEDGEAEKQNLDLEHDFEMKLAALKECVADVRNQYENKSSFQYISPPPLLVTSAATQTMWGVGEENHVVAVNDNNDDDEKVRERLAVDVLRLKNEIDNFDRRNVESDDKNLAQKQNSGSEIWDLKEELVILEKRIAHEEADKKRLQMHIEKLQSIIQVKEDELACMEQMKEEEGMKTDAQEALKIKALVQELKDQNQELQKSVNDLETRLALAEGEREEIVRDSVTIRETNEKLRLDFEKNLDLIRQERDRLKKDLIDLQNSNDKLSAELERCQKLAEANKDMIEKELAVARESKEKLTVDFEERLKVADKQKEQLREELISARESGKALAVDLKKRLEFAEQKNMELRKELEAAWGRCKKSKHEADEKDLDIASLKKDVEHLSGDIQSLTIRLIHMNELEGRVAELESVNKNLCDKNRALETKLIRVREERAAVENEQITRYIGEVEGLSRELTEARNAHELSSLEMSRLRAHSVNLSKEVNNLRDFLTTANAEKEQLKKEACERRRELERLSWYFLLYMFLAMACERMTFLIWARFFETDLLSFSIEFLKIA